MVQPLVIKFAGLVIKTLTKPIATKIKSAATNPGWIRACCLRYGRFHHQIESRTILRLAGHDAKSVKPTTDDAAVSIGATVFSEAFIFSVAGAVLLWEINKKAQDDEAAKVKKDEIALKERNALESRFQSLETELGNVTHELKQTQEELIQIKRDYVALTKKKGWI